MTGKRKTATLEWFLSNLFDFPVTKDIQSVAIRSKLHLHSYRKQAGCLPTCRTPRTAGPP